MRRLHAQPNGTPVVVVGIAFLSLFALTACGRLSDDRSAAAATPSPDEPIYYVDGARPSPGVNELEMTGTQYQDLCVPWSKERPDVYVCGPVSDSFEPAPPPGGIADYPAVCDMAAAIVGERAETLMITNALSTLPVIDIASCGAAGLGSAQESRWMAKFALANAQDVPPYLSVVVRSFTLDGSGGEGPLAVWLSEEP